MKEYKLLKQRTFESVAKFEKRLNEMAHKGWKPVSIGSTPEGAIILMVEDKADY
jgi:hypothetical protein